MCGSCSTGYVYMARGSCPTTHPFLPRYAQLISNLVTPFLQPASSLCSGERLLLSATFKLARTGVSYDSTGRNSGPLKSYNPAVPRCPPPYLDGCNNQMRSISFRSDNCRCNCKAEGPCYIKRSHHIGKIRRLSPVQSSAPPVSASTAFVE